jgi:hypothetical protein
VRIRGHWQDAEKAIDGLFSNAVRKLCIPDGLCFHWPTAIENGGTSCAAARADEKHRYSATC